jgi:Resolvase, N terminal domain
MSTDVQLKGDSLRRQMDASATYAATHDLELVEDLRDIGTSAFKGANVAGGALGRFLKAASGGKVPRGSYLLVESLDRISRQEIRKSLSLFLQIIEAGINIVTLTDRRVFNQEKCELEDLMMSLLVMSRAHEESIRRLPRVRFVNKTLRSFETANTHDSHRLATFANRAFARALTSGSQPMANFKSGACVSRGAPISRRAVWRSPFRARFTTRSDVCSGGSGLARSAAAETSSPIMMESTITTAAVPPAKTWPPCRFTRREPGWILERVGMDGVLSIIGSVRVSRARGEKLRMPFT